MYFSKCCFWKPLEATLKRDVSDFLSSHAVLEPWTFSRSLGLSLVISSELLPKRSPQYTWCDGNKTQLQGLLLQFHGSYRRASQAVNADSGCAGVQGVRIVPVTRPLIVLALGGSDGKEAVYNAGDPGLIPGSGRYSGEGNGNPLQCSCLGNSMDRRAWQATIHGVTKESDMTFS